MPWHCPACHTRIRHSESDDRPNTGAIYRCHVCRLELTWDAQHQKLEVKPFDHEHLPDLMPDLRKPR